MGVLQPRYSPGVLVPEVLANTAAERGGLRAGDKILAISGRPVKGSASAVNEFVETIA